MFSRAFILSLFVVSFASISFAAPVMDSEARSLETLETREPFLLPFMHMHKDQKELALKNESLPPPLPKSDHCHKKRTSEWKDATKKLTFYKPIASEKTSKDKNPVGKSPTGFDEKATDFSSKGGYYMFSDIDEAKWYGNALKTSKNTTHYSVVTLQWDPSKVSNLQLKEFKKADKEWNEFVLHNYQKNASRISPDRSKKLYQIIVGPIPSNYDRKDHKFEIEKSNVDCKDLYQFAIVDKAALAGLNITKVEDFKAKSAWTLHGGKEPK